MRIPGNTLWIELRIAWRFMVENPLQTLLIGIAIAAGSGVIIFLTTIMAGLQQNTIRKTLGNQAHIRLESTRLHNLQPQADGTARIVLETRRAQPLQRIDGWQAIVRALDELPGLSAVAPVVSGPALAQRGRASAAVVINGIDAVRYQKIVDLPGYLRQGRYHISSEDVLIGSELADELGLQAGDKLRLQAANARTTLVRVAGVFDTGVQELDSRQLYIELKQAQTLLNLPGGITALDIKIHDVFAARKWAARLQRLTGLHVKNWMDSNRQLLSALRSQDMSSDVIRVFVGLTVALGIASVLAVSVVQRIREIGILRAMGSSRQQVLRVFLLQGALLGAIGALFGMLGGYALVQMFNVLGSRLFLVELRVEVMLGAFVLSLLTGLLAAALPARRAAGYDPAEAIRYV